MKFKIFIIITICLSVFLIFDSSYAANTYTYDSLNRLTKGEYDNGLVIEYGYDAAGNRITLSSYMSKSQVTVDTSPSGLPINIDGVDYISPQVLTWDVSSQHTLNVPLSQEGSPGIRYVFDAWSDGGTQSHTITIPLSNTAYTASYKTQNLLTTTVDPDNSGNITVNPIGALTACSSLNSQCYWYDSGTPVTLVAGAISGYTFSNWSGDCAGLGTCSVTMDAPKTVTAKFNLVITNADLIVSTLTAPTTAVAGSAISISDTTKNQGTQTAVASTTKFYLSTNTTYDATDTYLGSRGVPSLSAGASSGPVSTSVTLPSGECGSTYYIIALADGYNRVGEKNETNNTRYKSIKIMPDLTIPVALLIAPTTGGAGQITNVTDTTKNNGGCPAGATTTKLYLSINSTWDAGDTYLDQRAVPALAIGATDTGITPVLIPDGTATGNYYIIAKADADAVVFETSETNNTKGKTIKIGPDLIILAITAPTSALHGSTISVKDTTKNSGGGTAGASTTKLYLSTNTTYEAGDTYLGERVVPNLAAGATSAVATSITIPAGTAAGTYYIIAVADANTTVAETSETNNTKYKVITIN